MVEPQDEFYTGYLPQAPPGIARRVRVAVIGLFVLAIAVAAILIVGQKPFAVAAFEFGVVRDFAGVIEEAPYPTLVVERPAGASGAGAVRADNKDGRDGQDVRQ